MTKRSFFERLAGATAVDDAAATTESRQIYTQPIGPDDTFEPTISTNEAAQPETVEEAYDEAPVTAPTPQETYDDEEGQLGVDVYQSGRMIVIKAIVGGVKRETLDISITRDAVTIRGRRDDISGAKGSDYYYRELYWGAFSRTVNLPEEIDIESAVAEEEMGLLTIKLPLMDKAKKAKLLVRPKTA